MPKRSVMGRLDRNKSIPVRTRRVRKLSEHIDARSFLDDFEFREFVDWDYHARVSFKRLTHNERLIYFCHWHLGWSIRTMVARIRISRRTFEKVQYEIQSYDSIVIPVPSRCL